jgi:hypothetical protein
MDYYIKKYNEDHPNVNKFVWIEVEKDGSYSTLGQFTDASVLDRIIIATGQYFFWAGNGPELGPSAFITPPELQKVTPCNRRITHF